MIRALIGELPGWARRDHPLLRYELGKQAPLRRRARFVNALVTVTGLLFLVVTGIALATGTFTHPAGANWVESLHAVAYFPLVFVQVIARIAAFSMTADAVGAELRRQNWDHVRATEQGAEMGLRARWIAVFYRMRRMIALVIGTRLLLIGLLLYDLTAFQGRYLDLLTLGIMPEVPPFVGVMLVALFMTAALALPLTGIAFDAAVGLLVSAVAQQRPTNSLLQFFAILLRVTLTVGLLIATWSWLQGTLALPDPVAWALLLALGGAGDWGASTLLLSRSAEIWAAVPYGMFLGAGLIAFALVQAWLAGRILHFAARRAQRG